MGASRVEVRLDSELFSHGNVVATSVLCWCVVVVVVWEK